MTELSIIVPVFNTEQYLRRCLDSLLDQDLDPAEYEILTVDDGSEDGSLAILEEFARAHPQITITSQANQGPAVARNRTIPRARGRYICFVDSDDYLAPRALGPLLRAAIREKLDVLAFGHELVGLDHTPSATPIDVSAPLDVVTGVDYVAAHRYTSESTCYLYDRALLNELGVEYDEGRIVEDVVFTATVVTAAQRLARVPDTVYYYVQRPGSIMRTTGPEHTRKLVTDYERVVQRLDTLRLEQLAKGAPSGYDDRIRVREQTFVFFLIARVVRSGLPARSVLTPVLERFRALDMYPMADFPANDFPGWHYRALTAVFNRSYLLWPFAAALSIARRLLKRP